MSAVKTGKTIESIAYKKSGVALVLSDGEKLTLTPDSFTEMPLYEGKTLSEKECAKLVSLAQSDVYYAYALKLCLADTKTVAEVRKKLEGKGASKEMIRSILSRLKEAGFLNDDLYAKVYASDIASLRCYGKKRVLYELRKRGISDAILSKLSFSWEDEKDKAGRYAAILNKKASKVPNSKKRMKMIEGLMERGFEEDVAREAVNDVATTNDPEEERNALTRDYFALKIRYERKYEGYELREHILSALIRKGYRYDDIKQLEEDNGNDD